MAFHLISFLGTSIYEPIHYQWPDSDTAQASNDVQQETFIQVALIKHFREEILQGGKATILLTPSAKETNWYNNVWPQHNFSSKWSEFNQQGIKPGAPRIGLCEQLKSIDAELFDHVRPVMIDEPKTRGDIWDLFDKIFGCIEDNDEIVFDITHSFRSIPMLAITVINYAKVLKNCRLKGIYYGAYEAAVENEHEKCAPILDLTVYNEILEWTNAANAFMQQGSTAVIKQVYDEKALHATQEEKREWSGVRDTISNMNTLSLALATCRGLDMTRKSGKENVKTSAINAYTKMKSKLPASPPQTIKEMLPVQLLLNKAVTSYDRFFGSVEQGSSSTDWQTGCGVVEWAIQYNMTQQGYTALEETIKTYLCAKYDLVTMDTSLKEMQELRETVGKILNSGAHWQDNHSLEGERDNWIAAFMDDTNREPRRSDYIVIADKNRHLFEKLMRELPTSVFVLTKNVKGFRNDINHFGMRDSACKATHLQEKLKEFYKEFRDYINSEGALSEC